MRRHIEPHREQHVGIGRKLEVVCDSRAPARVGKGGVRKIGKVIPLPKEMRLSDRDRKTRKTRPRTMANRRAVYVFSRHAGSPAFEIGNHAFDRFCDAL